MTINKEKFSKIDVLVRRLSTLRRIMRQHDNRSSQNISVGSSEYGFYLPKEKVMPILKAEETEIVLELLKLGYQEDETPNTIG